MESGRHGVEAGFRAELEPCTWQAAGLGVGWGSLEGKLVGNSRGKDPPHTPGIPRVWKRALEHRGTASHLLQHRGTAPTYSRMKWGWAGPWRWGFVWEPKSETAHPMRPFPRMEEKKNEREGEEMEGKRKEEENGEGKEGGRRRREEEEEGGGGQELEGRGRGGRRRRGEGRGREGRRRRRRVYQDGVYNPME